MKQHKTGLRFALLMIVSAIVGAILGMVSLGARDLLLDFGRALAVFLQQNAVWGMGVLVLIELGFGLPLLRSARHTVTRALAASEDDGLFDRADALCDRGVGMMSICNIVGFVCIGVGFAGIADNANVGLLVLLGLYVVSMVATMWLTNRFVLLTGELYPEKRASILSMKFHKEWFACCDEAERHQIGQASYVSMRAGQNACLAAMVVCILLAMFFQAGMLPILALGGVWLTQVASYLRACRKFKPVS